MAFDYKKEYKEFYMPKNKPSIVEIPKMNYIAVRGTGNPNEENKVICWDNCGGDKNKLLVAFGYYNFLRCEKQRSSAFFVPRNKNFDKNIDKCYTLLYTV